MSYKIFEQLCNQRGVTPYKVGKETGITTATFTNWKAGKYTPKSDKRQKIADYFGVSLYYLDTGDESMTLLLTDSSAAIVAKIMGMDPYFKLFHALADMPEDNYRLILELAQKLRGGQGNV